jgi:ABC-type Fe3+/spermidine/putrescine transport system ATPase subunit
MMKEDFLQIDVTKGYPEFQLEVQLTVAEGEFFSLVGPSGCGKTTLLRLISGLTRPDQGRIILNDRDLTALTVWERKIGFVFQDYALFPHLTVGGNIEYGLKIQRLPGSQRQERIKKMLALFELEELVDRRVQELSGGERQRVALARALAPEPFLLLLDEPFAALDYGLRRRLRRELKELQTKLGFTAIFVTHQQEEALSLSDRLAVMAAGRILQVGTAAEVYSNPVHPFVATFLGDANLIPCTVQSGPEGLTVHPQGGKSLLLPSAPGRVCGSYLLMLRPEDLFLTTDAPVFTGEIRTAEYIGYGFSAEVEVGGGLILKLLPGKENPLLPGERVGLAFRPQAAKVIPDGAHHLAN